MKIIDILPIYEKRSNPDKNPKISAVTALEKYKNDENIYISFTKLNKIGIYPLSEDGDTPLGIYAFPLKKCWKEYYVESNGNFSEFPNIVQGKQYIQVIEVKNSNKKDLKFFDVEDYTDEDFDSDFVLLQNIFRFHDIGMILEKSKYTGCSAFEKLYRLTDELSKNYKDWNYTFRRLGYAGFVDNGNGWIHEMEPYQAVFFGKDAFNHIDSIENKLFRSVSDEIKTINPVVLSVPEMVAMADRLGRRIKKFEPFIIKDGNPNNIMRYMQYSGFMTEWREAEPILKTDARAAFNYATKIIGKRFRFAEDVISKNERFWEDYKEIFGIKRKF